MSKPSLMSCSEETSDVVEEAAKSFVALQRSAGSNGLNFDLNFEPDVAAEEELAEEDEGEFVDPALITDREICKCRLLAAIQCVEYGTVSLSPGSSAPGVLLCVSFTFHPFETRVKEASVELALNKAIIAVLQPESVDDDETSEMVRKKLSGEFKIGYAAAGVEASVGAERESEREKTSERRIRGSGVHTPRATWTLRENSRNKKGIHLKFVTVLIARPQGAAAGGLELDVEIRAKLGPSLGNGLGIRHALARTTKRLDGATALGFTPSTLDISKNIFVSLRERNGKTESSIDTT
jgi:hypothetical protein